MYAGRHEGEPRNAVAVASMLALTVVAPLLCMARAALDPTLATAARKPMSLTVHERLADSPSVQLAAAEARQLTVAERARIRRDTAVAATRSREAVDRLVSVSACSASPTTTRRSSSDRRENTPRASASPWW